MRRGDYPKGDSNGVKRATKEAILKVLKNKTRNIVTIKPLVLFIKDTGLRVSDVRQLKYGDIVNQFEKGDNIIQINIITHTFIPMEPVKSVSKCEKNNDLPSLTNKNSRRYFKAHKNRR